MVTNQESPHPSDLIGRTCGGSYVVTSLLGEGGCGQVYLATSRLLANKPAAVKVLHLDATRRPEALSRFYAEVFAAGKIDDPNIVEVFDAGRFADGRMYMIMQYCAGGSLESLLDQRGALPLDLAFAITACVGQALDTAHRNKITHRDIKPANILLVREPNMIRAKLADFGIAKLHDEQLLFAMQTATRKVMGSPGYMAPEQCSGKGARSADHRTDIYAFASVIYEMVTGRRPYLGTSMYALITSVSRNEPFPRPRELRPDLPAEIDELIMEGLAHRREERIQTVKELVLRFAQWLPSGEALLSYFAPRLVDYREAPPSAATIADGIGPAVTKWTEAHTTLGTNRGGRAGRRVVWLVAGAALGAGALALALAVRGSDDAPALPIPPGSTHSATPVTAAEKEGRASDGADAAADAGTSDEPSPSPSPSLSGAAASPVTSASSPTPAPGAAAPAPSAPASSMPTSPAPTRRARVEYGWLSVDSDTWADVRIAGLAAFSTPHKVKLPAGRHRVVLTKLTQKETRVVIIKPNETLRIFQTW